MLSPDERAHVEMLRSYPVSPDAADLLALVERLDARWESLKSPEMVARVAGAIALAHGRDPKEAVFLDWFTAAARAALEEITR